MIWAGLALQTLVFALWVWLAFRSLFRLARWGRAASGRMLPGPGWALRAAGVFLRDPDFAPDRRWLGLATLALFAIGAANQMAGPPYG